MASTIRRRRRTRTQQMTPEQIARQAEINARLETVHQAIQEGRAYLDTAWGRRKVVSYHHDTGDCITNDTGSVYDQRSFLICLDSIKID